MARDDHFCCLHAQAEEWAPTQAAATSKKKQAEEAKKSERTSMREADKQQATATNAAAVAAFGSKAQKWGAWSSSAAKQPVTAPQNTTAVANRVEAAEKETRPESRSGEGTGLKSAGDKAQKSGFLPPSRVKAEMLSAKLQDLVAVMEGHHMYQKSTLLYKLYDRLPN